jgi:OOP family OmpA-OmpF porin
MKNIYKATPIGAALLLAAANSHANQLYLGVDGGGAFQQTISIRDNSGFNGGGNIKFNTGWRVDGDIGYGFNKYFSTELNAGLIYNQINSIGNQQGTSAHLDEVPILINGIFTWPLGKLKPYVGVGVGVAITTFDGSNITGTPTGSYRDTDTTLAYQGEAGLRYSLTRHLDLGVEYKFVGTTDHKWSDNSIVLKTDGTMTHTILGTFTYRF